MAEILKDGEAFIINWPREGMPTDDEGLITPDQAAANIASQDRSAYKDVRVLPFAIDETSYSRGSRVPKDDESEVAIVGKYAHIK
jgi:hypothetical protein